MRGYAHKNLYYGHIISREYSSTAFTRAFQAIHGISPSQVKDGSVSIKAFPPLVFQMNVRGTQEIKLQYSLY